MKLKRCAGVLLHPTSLPSPWGVGDLGPTASRFLDLLEEAKQSIWQILPLTPVAGHGSPYSAHSLFAGNSLLLSPERLAEDRYIPDLSSLGSPSGGENAVDFVAAAAFKDSLVKAAFAHSYSRVRREDDFARFLERNSDWLDDYALYDAISKEQGGAWYEWPEGIRRRERSALDEKRATLCEAIELTVFSQYLFERQWSALADRARSKGIKILGDVPFYVLHDSADIWAHPDLFKVDETGGALLVGGVPPDYFSETGQRWGNPVYDWRRLEETGYGWWKSRALRSLELTEMLRLDHFRGYVAYWEIPAGEPTAVNGRWVKVPGSFIDFLESSFPELPFVAEDLGVITEDVNEARERLGIPGMRVLQFAFDGSSDNVHLPANYTRNSFVYTGTHDTNTGRGWFREEATPKEREELARLVGHSVTEESVSRDLIALAMGSVADVSVVPMQDLLSLGSEARMNNPAKSEGNWMWRALTSELSDSLFRRLGELTSANGRR